MVIALVVLGEGVSPLPLVVVVFVVYLLGFWATGRPTRDLRSRCRHLHALFITLDSGVEAHGAPLLLKSTIAGFGRLDSQLAAGLVTPVQYEAEWQRIYDSIPSDDTDVPVPRPERES